jgi:hypothetical protein
MTGRRGREGGAQGGELGRVHAVHQPDQGGGRVRGDRQRLAEQLAHVVVPGPDGVVPVGPAVLAPGAGPAGITGIGSVAVTVWDIAK